MKIQDITFLMAFIFLLFKRDPKWAASLGLICIILSIPLFSFWIFFTAERLTWYAAAFFFLAGILQLIQLRKNED